MNRKLAGIIAPAFHAGDKVSVEYTPRRPPGLCLIYVYCEGGISGCCGRVYAESWSYPGVDPVYSTTSSAVSRTLETIPLTIEIQDPAATIRHFGMIDWFKNKSSWA